MVLPLIERLLSEVMKISWKKVIGNTRPLMYCENTGACQSSVNSINNTPEFSVSEVDVSLLTHENCTRWQPLTFY